MLFVISDWVHDGCFANKTLLLYKCLAFSPVHWVIFSFYVIQEVANVAWLMGKTWLFLNFYGLSCVHVNVIIKHIFLFFLVEIVKVILAKKGIYHVIVLNHGTASRLYTMRGIVILM